MRLLLASAKVQSRAMQKLQIFSVSLMENCILVQKLPQGEEWEETEELITLDLKLSPEELENAQVELIGLNTQTPLIKVGNKIFQGNHEKLIGSEIFLQAVDTKKLVPLPQTTSSRILFEPLNEKSL